MEREAVRKLSADLPVSRRIGEKSVRFKGHLIACEGHEAKVKRYVQSQLASLEIVLR